jgi:hypothetical protein
MQQSRIETRQNRSALLALVTQAVDTVADGVAETESAEEPFVRVTAAVSDGALTATAVVAATAGV